MKTGRMLLIPLKTQINDVVWNHDVCSSLNIMNVAYSNVYGNLPKCLVRKANCESVQPEITDSTNETFHMIED